MQLKRDICYVLYNTFAVWLPRTNATVSLGSKKIREVLVRGFARSAGRGIEIQRGARISKSLSVGNNSGVGINCALQGSVSIGDNVMMGPEV